MRDLDIGSMVVNVNGYASAMGHRQHPAPARTNQRSLHNKALTRCTSGAGCRCDLAC
jgi:hypothetical protein